MALVSYSQTEGLGFKPFLSSSTSAFTYSDPLILLYYVDIKEHHAGNGPVHWAMTGIIDLGHSSSPLLQREDV